MSQESESDEYTSDDEEGEYGDSEEEEEEEGEDKEPKLKYQRLGGSLHSIFNSGNRATAFKCAQKFLSLGTDKGFLFILDFDGNTNKDHKYRPHVTRVNDISIDARGEYIATCSVDGRVVIRCLFNNTTRWEYKFNHPLTTVTLDPLFSKQANKTPFVCGGQKGQLIYTRRGFFRKTETIIHQGEGPIYKVRWKRNLIAWGNDLGVKVVDISTNQRITHIGHPRQYRPSQFRCEMVWMEIRPPPVGRTVPLSPAHQPSTPTKPSDGGLSGLSQQQLNNLPPHYLRLVIGWANMIQILSIYEKRSLVQAPTGGGMTQNKVYVSEVTRLIELGYIVCGLAPYLPGQLVILSYEQEKPNEVPEPEFRIYEYQQGDEELSIDTLLVKDYHVYQPHQYILAFSFTEYKYYIVSEKDIVVASKRTVDDHINWLLKAQRYDEALFYAKEHESELKIFKVKVLGEIYLNHLIKQNKFKEASLLVPKIAEENTEVWEELIYKFIEDDKENLRYIIPYIPYREPCILRKDIYNMVLHHYLDHDEQALLTAIFEWNLRIYDIALITESLEKKIKIIDLDRQKEDFFTNENDDDDDNNNNPNKVRINNEEVDEEEDEDEPTLEDSVSKRGSVISRSKKKTSQFTRKFEKLLQSLQKLYVYQAYYDKAVRILYTLRSSNIFEFIKQHDLRKYLRESIIDLMDLHSDRCIKLLQEQVKFIKVKEVVNVLEHEKREKELTKYFLSLYYACRKKQLESREIILEVKKQLNEYHMLHIELLCKYKPHRTLDFLKNGSQDYDLDQALEICQIYYDKIVSLFKKKIRDGMMNNLSSQLHQHQTENNNSSMTTSMINSSNIIDGTTTTTNLLQEVEDGNNNNNIIRLKMEWKEMTTSEIRKYQKHLVRGIVYLNRRMGSPVDALELILSKLKLEIAYFEVFHSKKSQQKNSIEETQQESQSQSQSQQNQNPKTKYFKKRRKGSSSVNVNEKQELLSTLSEDMELAVDIVKADEDEMLWDLLIQNTIKIPLLINDLLENISKYVGIYIDPVDLVCQIPDDIRMEPALKEKIISIMSNYSLQKTLQEECSSILTQDIKNLSFEVLNSQKKGVRFSKRDQFCMECKSVQKRYIQEQQQKQKMTPEQLLQQQQQQQQLLQQQQKQQQQQTKSELPIVKKKKMKKQKKGDKKKGGKEIKEEEEEEEVEGEDVNNNNNNNTEYEVYDDDFDTEPEEESFVYFFCGHCYHLTCYTKLQERMKRLLKKMNKKKKKRGGMRSNNDDDDDDDISGGQLYCVKCRGKNKIKK